MAFDLDQLIRLGKKYLVPNLKKWFKKYKEQQQQDQSDQHQQHPPGHQQQHGGGFGQPCSQQGAWGGQDHRPTHHQQQQQQQPAHAPSQQHHAPHQNQDSLNASNAQYVELRNQAIQAGDLMGQAFEQSHRAYASGDGARAKQLSNEGKQHQQSRDRLNEQAAEWIFNENNKQSPQGTVDLHGLYVQEAIRYTEKAIQDARAQQLTTLRVIVGKGNHSAGHVAKIKPAIEDLMRKYQLAAHLDQHNAGVLVVDLTGQHGSRDAGFADQMDNDQCLIM